MIMRESKRETIDTLRRRVDHLNDTITLMCKKNDELMLENTELKVQNARMEERLKIYAPEIQEHSESD